MSEVPSAFYDFREDEYPFTLCVQDEVSDEVLWEVTIDGPGALHVPGFTPRRVKVTMTTNDGQRVVTYANGCSVAYFVDGSSAPLPPTDADGVDHGQ